MHGGVDLWCLHQRGRSERVECTLLLAGDGDGSQREGVRRRSGGHWSGRSGLRCTRALARDGGRRRGGGGRRVRFMLALAKGVAKGIRLRKCARFRYGIVRRNVCSRGKGRTSGVCIRLGEVVSNGDIVPVGPLAGPSPITAAVAACLQFKLSAALCFGSPALVARMGVEVPGAFLVDYLPPSGRAGSGAPGRRGAFAVSTPASWYWSGVFSAGSVAWCGIWVQGGKEVSIQRGGYIAWAMDVHSPGCGASGMCSVVEEPPALTGRRTARCDREFARDIRTRSWSDGGGCR